MQRFLSFFGVFVLIVSLGSVSAFAASSNSNEFVFKDYVEYSFSDYDTVVTANANFPQDWIRTNVFGTPGYRNTYSGPVVSFGTSDTLYDYLRLEMLPFGGNAYTGHEVGFQFENTKILDIRYVPQNTVVRFGFDVLLHSSKIGTYPKTTFMLYFVDSNGKVVYKYTDGFNPGISYGNNFMNIHYYCSIDLESLNLPSNAVGFVPYMLLSDLYVDFDSVDIKYQPFEFVYSMSALQYESSRNDQLQDTMTEVQSSLDELLDGGEAGDDLIAGGDRLEDAGSDMGDDLGAIQDFEDQYMGQLDDNMDEVVKGADLTWIYPALAFVQRYLNKIVSAIPSKYLIVFTLPMFFGLFMYIVGHPVRAPRPDTSGDEVTRETFTETHILTGKNAGSVRSTRTVTTSREIGRVHNE